VTGIGIPVSMFLVVRYSAATAVTFLKGVPGTVIVNIRK